jgi:hypothetical protein
MRGFSPALAPWATYPIPWASTTRAEGRRGQPGESTIFQMGSAWHLRECALISHEGPMAQENDEMTAFDDRRNAFEKQFAHDEDLRFKATARRNKLFGLWVADRLGKTGDEAETYAKSIVLADFEEAGDADVLRKAYKDLEGAGKTADEAELKAKLVQLTERAIEEVKAGR